MNLTREGRERLRISVVEELERVPDGKLVKLPKDVLEQLLFEEFVYNKKENKSVRLPIWSGRFLQKLDLSEVDFTNVAWGVLDYFSGIQLHSMPLDTEYELVQEYNDKYSKWGLELTYKGIPVVVYAGTNAKIDFTKSFEFINFDGEVRLDHCDLSEVDLSNVNLSECSKLKVKHSRIANTNLKIHKGTSLDIESSNLEGIDLSEIELSSFEELDSVLVDRGYSDNFSRNFLNNTGLRIVCNKNKLSALGLFVGKDESLIKDYLEKYLSGCYINGQLIEDQEAREAREASEISNVLEMVRKQR